MFKEEKQKLEDKIQVLRAENEALKDEIQMKKVDLSKEIALKDQKYEFLENKVTEMQQQHKARVMELEKQFDSLKQEHLAKFTAQDKQACAERTSLEQKLEAARTTMKAKEQQLIKEKQELERQSALIAH